MRRNTFFNEETGTYGRFVSSHFFKDFFCAVLNVVLYQPEIPPNTGNIIRLCANTGARLHLVGPLGFVLDDARLKRAGLDYRDMAEVRQYEHWNAFTGQNPNMPLWAFSTRGSVPYHEAGFCKGDGLLFGPESRGLPDDVLGEFPAARRLRLPMRQDSRSLNLSNTVAVGLYEGLRQLGFENLY
jgi:tRNA (cytidine(34)-2'-O)-methyltransferase